MLTMAVAGFENIIDRFSTVILFTCMHVCVHLIVHDFMHLYVIHVHLYVDGNTETSTKLIETYTKGQYWQLAIHWGSLTFFYFS